MNSSFAVLAIAALLVAAVAAWVLRAYRHGGDAAAPPKPVPALVCAVAGAVAALGLYLVLGRPDLGDAPFRPRLDALLAQVERGDPVDSEQALALWHEAARRNPRAAEPQLYIGDLYLQTGRPQDAARAYDAALRRDANSGAALMGLGRAFVQIDGSVSPRAVSVFEAASEAAPAEPAPWLYRAQAALEAGEDGRALWREALARMAPDDPRRAMAQQMVQGQ